MNVVDPINVTAWAAVVTGVEVVEKGVTMQAEVIMVVREEMAMALAAIAAVVIVGATRQKKTPSKK